MSRDSNRIARNKSWREQNFIPPVLSNETGVEHVISTCTDVSECEPLTYQCSRFSMLPPIEPQRSQCPPARKTSVVFQEKKETKKRNDIDYDVALKRNANKLEKSLALPPISDKEGRINTLLKQKYMANISSRTTTPRKRTRTHVIHRPLERGDSWELIKAEKIRCSEKAKYEKERSKKNRKSAKKKHHGNY